MQTGSGSTGRQTEPRTAEPGPGRTLPCIPDAPGFKAPGNIPNVGRCWDAVVSSQPGLRCEMDTAQSALPWVVIICSLEQNLLQHSTLLVLTDGSVWGSALPDDPATNWGTKLLLALVNQWELNKEQGRSWDCLKCTGKTA